MNVLDQRSIILAGALISDKPAVGITNCSRTSRPVSVFGLALLTLDADQRADQQRRGQSRWP
jgi:hypothetical protein